MTDAASLPMYNFAPVRPHLDRFWTAFAEVCRDAGIDNPPSKLNHGEDLEAVWGDPGLFLSQVCGYPFTHKGRGRWRYVATPCYDLDGCEPWEYFSHVVVREESGIESVEGLRGKTGVISTMDSQSGMNALRVTVAPFNEEGRFFDKVLKSGSHKNSAAMVRSGEGDVAAIDAITWRVWQTYLPELAEGLKVIDRTKAAPAMPLVTSTGRDDGFVKMLRHALDAVMSDPGLAETRQALFFTGVKLLDEDEYERIVEMERCAAAMPYALEVA